MYNNVQQQDYEMRNNIFILTWLQLKIHFIISLSAVDFLK